MTATGDTWEEIKIQTIIVMFEENMCKHDR